MVKIKHYTASWCAPCRTLKPIMQEIALENPNVLYEYIDVDQNKSEVENNNIRSVPTVVIEKNGVETKRFTGVQPKEIYQQAIK